MLHLALTIALAAPAADAPNASVIRFGRDIRPLLSDRCFQCHGPDADAREARLRLDSFEDATARRKRGRFAIIPGDPDGSLLWQRISTTDPLDQMPPPEHGKPPLTPEEQALIRAWIESGAAYEPHWAFAPLEQPTPPAKDSRTAGAAIDAFILDGLGDADPSPPTDSATLCRRLFLDLTGLPPTIDELDAFLEDDAPDAYERLVDRLLTEEPYVTRYAEHMATPWLDLARYADTAGIHTDAGRSIWLYRDWVIEAFRNNMPLDQFMTEQLAGDLLDGASDAQKIASGFNRCHVTTDEGGFIDDEALFMYAVDRTNTYGTVFLGLTVNCAQCHDHKFDPIGMEDYYSLLAFFNNNEEPGLYAQYPDPTMALEPAMQRFSSEQRVRIEELEDHINSVKAERDHQDAGELQALQSFREDLTDGGNWSWSRPGVVEASSGGGAQLDTQPDGRLLASGENPANDDWTIRLRTTETGLRALLLEVLQHESLPMSGPGRAANGNMILSGITAKIAPASHPDRTQPLNLVWAWADVEQPSDDFRVVNALQPDDGRMWAINAHRDRDNRYAMFVTEEPFGFRGGTEITVRLSFNSPYAQHSPGHIGLQVATATEEAMPQLATAASNWYIVGPFTTQTGDEAYDTIYGPEAVGPLDFDAAWHGQSWRYAPGVKEAEVVSLARGIGAEYVARELWSPVPRRIELSMGSDDGLQVYVNGALVHEARVDRGAAPDQELVTFDIPAGRSTLVCKFVNTGGEGGMYHRAIVPEAQLQGDAIALTLPEDIVSESLDARRREAWRLASSPRYRALTEQIKTMAAEATTIRESAPSTMVMQERDGIRDTYVMMRGAYDAPDGDRPVNRNVPAALGHLDGDALDRRDLAAWTVGEDNPITARVFANRLWQHFFGRGLAETVEDFGLQGSWPTHPDLLDWIATDLRNDWNLQDTIRHIVLSDTYRQRSGDDFGRYAAFPRQRLSAEQIRDQALHVGDLLVEQVGGPGVKPYQPTGLWQEVAMPQSNTRTFEQGEGDDLWRRSIYTYWKRAAPPPSMVTFDAPTREYCSARRLPTNTPLQALVLWNDPQFVEAARATATRVVLGNDPDPVASLYRRCTGSVPSEPIAASMRDALEGWRARYKESPEDAAALIAIGDSDPPADIDQTELAAWTMLASAVLSSDAAIVKD